MIILQAQRRLSFSYESFLVPFGRLLLDVYQIDCIHYIYGVVYDVRCPPKRVEVF